MTSLLTALKAYKEPRIFLFFFLGLACGIPFSLVGNTLKTWMTEGGMTLESVGYLSLILLPYSLKFLWAPAIDHVRIKGLSTKFGQKKTWGFLAQIGLMISVLGVAASGQQQSMIGLFFWGFLTAFFAATQDIVVDALRIDTLQKKELGEGAGTYQLGYRLGMLFSGAVLLWLSGVLDWVTGYVFTDVLILFGMLALFFIREPVRTRRVQTFKKMVVNPFKDFVQHNYHWGLLLAFIICYKLCNTVLGAMAYPFYIEAGFTKKAIALVSGTYGVGVTLIGIPIGGILAYRLGALKSLWYLGFVEIATSLAFMFLACAGVSLPIFLMVITFDNIVGGMGSAVFVAFLSSLCQREYSATQYALLTSIMAITTSFLASLSGHLAALLGWPLFFATTGLFMIPALMMLKKLMKKGF